MRLSSSLVIAALMLVAAPGLLLAQSGDLASAGQLTAGPSGTSTESAPLPAASIQSASATQQSTDHGPAASAVSNEASMAGNDGAAAPPDVGPVPVPAPEELSGAASASAEASATDGSPSLAAASAGIRANVAREDASSRAAAHDGGIGTAGILMIVGGAAILAGLLIGGGAGTAIAVAGAVAGLYGLYLYLK
jgi:hypothetical protein